MPGTHSLLGASKAHQYLACPPSARLNQKLIDKFGEPESPFAAEGTKAHSLCELKLLKERGDLNKFNFEEQVKALGDIPAEMEHATDIYVDTIMEKYFAAKKVNEDAQLLIEQKLDFSDWVPHGWGTGDAVIVSDASLEVCDFKYGKGVPVDAKENPQARLYGLGALNEFGLLYGFSQIRTTIIQPRLDSITEETLTREELLAWGDSIHPLAVQAWEGVGEFKPGDHCRFCNARAICKARAIESFGIFTHGFDAPEVLSDDVIPEILKVADTAEAWLKDVKAYALNQALQGQQFRGYKLVQGRAPARKWKDEEEVLKQMAKAGYEPEQYQEPAKLKTVAALEKSIGKTAFKALLPDATVQGQPALTLVPESDKREAYNPVLVDFGDIKTDNMSN